MKLHRSDIIASIETCERMEQSEVWIIISCGSENRFYLWFEMPCGTSRTAGYLIEVVLALRIGGGGLVYLEDDEGCF